MLSKDRVLYIFNTTRRRIRWISWIKAGIASWRCVLAYLPKLRAVLRVEKAPSIRQSNRIAEN